MRTNERLRYIRQSWSNTFFIGVILLGIVTIGLAVGLALSRTAAAAQTVPYKLNYQGQLTNAAGTPMADGQYNMKFRLFSVLSGGSAVWSETRETTNRVTVTGGQFSVQLGEVSALSPSLFTSYPLYLEVELPTVASATCSTSACGVYTEGAMTPRQSLASSAYAMNADTLDGYDSSSFIIASSNNTYTGTNLFKNTANSSSAFGVQQANGTSLFAVDTTAGAVSLGTGGGSSQFGNSAIGTLTDTNNPGTYEMSRYQTGAAAGAISSVTMYIGSTVDSAPNNKYTMAIYSDNAGVPGTLLATSTEGSLITGWNTTPIGGATLNPSTYYWIAYMTNSTNGATNNMNYTNTGQSCWQARSYASGYPASAPACSSASQAFSMYVTFGATNPALVATSTGRVGIGTSSPTTSLEVDGNVLFKNVADTTSAFQIQTAAAASLFIADTTNSRIQIGSSTADATAIVLVLDTKNTAGDPTGVAGAMYYNSASRSFRCYQDEWRSCTGGVVTSSTATQTISNSATLTTLSPAYTMPANACTPGRVYRVTASGTYQTFSTAPTLTVTINADATVLASTGASLLSASISTLLWTLKADVICQTAGASGSVEASGMWTGVTGATTVGAYQMRNTAPVTLDTTVSHSLNVTAKFGTANASNTFIMRQLYIEALGP